MLLFGKHFPSSMVDSLNDDDLDESLHRSFGIDDDIEVNVESSQKELRIARRDYESMMNTLRKDILGDNEPFVGPFGTKFIIYCDWTASGKCLKSIEDYIHEKVMKFYGNTHTTTSITGHQSSCFRNESRQIIAEATNAKVNRVWHL